MIARSQMVLIGAILGSAVLSFFSSRIDDYVLDVTIGVGINIMLAVSLNLINGYTGQFSLGHAGFMAVGAYTAGALTTHLGPQVVGTLGGGAGAATLLFSGALLAGGLLAALAGFVVGVPSLRLKGDYLAIVTLGFGEIAARLKVQKIFV